MKTTVRDLVLFVEGYQARFGWAPSRREIGKHFEIGMMRTQELLREAEADGWIETGPYARQVRVMRHINEPRNQL